MKKTIILLPEAETDIEEAFKWYESHKLDLGSKFIVEIDALFERISENPGLFPKIYHNLRRGFTHRFPYVVYFIADDNQVSVYGVLHQRRNPIEWQIRLHNLS